MRYAKIREMDISNGDGLSVSLFVQGCLFKCKGCFNQESWDFNGGKKWTPNIENNFIRLCKKDFINHVSILGGEPLQQDSEFIDLLIRLKEEVNKPVWLWTGYKLENIPDEKKEILKYVDVLIDGQFIEELKDYRLQFKGSINQNTYIKGTDY